MRWAIIAAIGLLICTGPARAADEERKSAGDTLEEYRARREKLPDKDKEALLTLAKWCEDNNLKSYALNHYREVLKLDPKNDEANTKLGNQLIDTPKGRLWLSKAQAAEYEEEKDDFTMPEGNTAKFLRAWEKRVPIRVRMKDEAVESSEAKRYGWYNTRVRKMLVTEVTLTNSFSGILEADGKKLANGKRWTDKDVRKLLWTGYNEDWSMRRWLSHYRLEVPFKVEGEYGHTLSLKYIIEVPEDKTSVLRTAEADQIAKTLDIRLEEDRHSPSRRWRVSRDTDSDR